MKKKFVTYFPIIILIFFLICIFKYNRIVISSILFAFNITFKNIIPSLIPIFIISDLLINYGFVEILGKFLRKPFNKLFGISENAVFVVILSMISGCPSNAKYIKELLDSNKIS